MLIGVNSQLAESWQHYLSPFDNSKSPESVNPEEPVLKLQRSVTIEREVKVPVEVQGPAFPIKVDALLDSGATGCFMDKSWALERRIELKPLKNLFLC